jgi:hypothetical protein
MDDVESVQQLGDTRLRSVAEIGNKREECDAEITEQNPDELVAWKANGGKGNAGVVSFHRLNDEETRVTVQMDWEPEGVVENVGTAFGFDDRQVSKDLDPVQGADRDPWPGERRLARGGLDADRRPNTHRGETQRLGAWLRSEDA